MNNLFRYSKWFWAFLFAGFSIKDFYLFSSSYNVILLSKGILSLLLMVSFSVRSNAKKRSYSTKAFIITLIPIFIPLLLSTKDAHLVREEIFFTLIILGIAVSALSVIELWDSFGALPSVRKLKFGGPYKAVRHPVYTGYLLTAIGITLAGCTAYNLSMLILLIVFMVLRIGEEEKLLSTEVAYLEYKDKVKYRLIPCIF